MLATIKWDVNPEIIDGYATPNWYGVLFITGMIIGYFVIRKMYRNELVPDEKLDKLLLYVVPATIIGARLGHVLFYGPYWDKTNEFGIVEKGYFSHPFEIVKIWEGGLASHGGAFMLLIALWVYAKREVKQPSLWIFDRIAAPIAITGMFIRLANLVNGEIVGYETDVPWAFQFMREDCKSETCPWEDIPARHPAQLYEAIAYGLIFLILFRIYWKKSAWKVQGRVFGYFLILLFGARFVLEFFKVGQTDRDDTLAINTGQILSIPFVLLGCYLLWRSYKNPIESVYQPLDKKKELE